MRNRIEIYDSVGTGPGEAINFGGDKQMRDADERVDSLGRRLHRILDVLSLRKLVVQLLSDVAAFGATRRRGLSYDRRYRP
jgi:hypothetical protein